MVVRGFGMRPWFSAAVWIAVIQHYLWAILLLVSTSAGSATATSAVVQLFGGSIGLSAFILTVASTLALVALLVDLVPLHRIVFLLPQQALLTAAALEAIRVIVTGHYADGVSRPWPFIAADQAVVILLMLAHSGGMASKVQ